MKEKRPMKSVLPSQGIITIEDLAIYLEMDSHQVIQKLTDNGIKILMLSSRPKHKLVRLESLRPKEVVSE